MTLRIEDIKNKIKLMMIEYREFQENCCDISSPAHGEVSSSMDTLNELMEWINFNSPINKEIDSK